MPDEEKTYTPPPVTGYRTLTQAEVDLMNEIKAKGAEMDTLLTRVASHINKQTWADNRQLQSEPYRWLAMAKSDLQVGIMKLTRAVAQPLSF